MVDDTPVELYFEDIAPGARYDSGTATVTEESIARFDLEFGLPEADGSRDQRRSAASSYVASITMRLLVESGFRPAGGIQGSGIDDLRWPNPVRAGDVLRISSEVLETRRSRSRPEKGIVRVRTTTLNDRNAPVQTMTAHVLVPCRASDAA